MLNFEIEAAYDNGWRAGMFDKCNGREENKFLGWCVDSDANRAYMEGYIDGYVTNERKI